MENLFGYGFILVIMIAATVVICHYILNFLSKPTAAQVQQIKEWLIYAVAEAERELGSGTGQLKLRYVYDMFLTKFGMFASVIPFTTFSLLVDEALDQFKALLNTNKSVKSYIDKE